MTVFPSKKSSYLIYKLTILFLFFSFVFITSNAYAWDNCPFGEINEPFPGTCGRYIDTDNDNICDYSQPSPENRVNLIEEENTNLQEVVTSAPNNSSSNNKGINYYFIPILLLLCIFYFLTFFLSKKKKIKRIQHRKIWNIILLVTFLVSGIIGLILAILISNGIKLSFYTDLLFWHVEFGIAMAIISLFHIAWHWNYYKKMVINN
jgi:hypothetical protein